jgi:hypothetical protein
LWHPTNTNVHTSTTLSSYRKLLKLQNINRHN